MYLFIYFLLCFDETLIVCTRLIIAAAPKRGNGYTHSNVRHGRRDVMLCAARLQYFVLFFCNIVSQSVVSGSDRTNRILHITPSNTHYDL